MQYEDTKLSKLFEQFGGWPRIIKSLDFRISLIFSILFLALALGLSVVPALAIHLYPAFMAAAPALVAVAIAGLAIVVALSDPKFIKKLADEKVFSNILLHYVFPAFSAGLSIFVSMAGVFMGQFTDSVAIHAPLLFFSTASFAYSLTGVISAITTTLRYGVYRSEFIRRNLL